ncbi:MAG: rhomboid family intramembrane serine protease [Acidimicrobiia bacterium]|nr:rhomboid family intramembrane serine protease [Acidimicrobiia bacterium]
MTQGLQHCYRHPDRETGLACSNCGKPICPDCSVDAVVGQRCLDCHKEIGTTRVSRGTGIAALGPVTKALLAINLAVYVLQWLPGGAEFVFPFVQVNSSITNEGTWWTLLTSAFIHFDLWHIGFNGYALYVLGPRVEARLGTGPFLGLYMFAAVTGGVGGYLLGGPGFAQIGASGAIYGIAGYLFWQWWPARRTPQGRQGWQLVLWLVGIGIILPFALGGFISWQGHLGGMVGGLLVAAGWDTFRITDRVKRTAFAIVPAIAILAFIAASVW